LSASEKNEIRKQLRLVKNRESAHASRLRKKSYLDEMERRVNALHAENAILRQNSKDLHNENAQLKSEVVYLKGVVSKTGISKMFQSGASFFSKLSQQSTSPGVGAEGANKASPALINPRNAGVVLMVVLLSVGLLFNSPQLDTSSTMVPAVTRGGSESARVLKHAQFKPASEVRDVLTLFEQSEMPTQRIRQMVEKQRAVPDPASHKLADVDHAVPIVAKQSDPQQVAPESSAPAAQVAPSIAWKANTTYLLCPQVQKLTPPTSAADLEPAKKEIAPPVLVSFLIPPQVLSDAPEAHGDFGEERRLMEVTCQVVDVAMRSLPRQSLDVLA